MNTITNTAFQTAERKDLFQTIQPLLNMFVFFVVFPCLDVMGNSVTFYIFLYIVFSIGIFWTTSFRGKTLLFLFLLFVFLSNALAPYDRIRERTFVNAFTISIQFTYWIFLACFMIVFRNKINLYQLSKWVFYGVVAAVIGYFLFVIKFGGGGVSINTKMPRNAYVFTMLCSMPLAFYYLMQRYSKFVVYFILLCFVVALLLTNGRSGAIIIMLESVFIFILFNPGLLKFLKVAFIPMFLGVLFLQSDFIEPYMETLAEKVEPLSPRLASLIVGEEEGDLTQDKSWLHRKLMIDKSIEIFEEFPLLGIGATNFSKFDSELETFDDDKYYRLSNHDRDWYNNRSAHNTYVQVLSEFGIIGLTIFIILLLIPLLFLVRLLFNNNFKIYHLPLISLLGMSIHFYAISAITGAVPWMVLGLAIASTYRKT